MQLISDGIAVLGARHGIAFDPYNRRSYLVRTQLHPGTPCSIRAGIVVNGREVLFPLCKEGETFSMVEQDMSPTSMGLTGIDPKSGLKVELRFVTPFKPKDEVFSTTPIIDVTMKLKFLDGNFRWEPRTVTQFVKPSYLFFTLDYPAMKLVSREDNLIQMESQTRRLRSRRSFAEELDPVAQREAWVIHQGQAAQLDTAGVIVPFDDSGSAELHFSWCLHSDPAMSVGDRLIPYRYTQTFPNIDSLVSWSRAHEKALIDNSRIVDAVIGDNNCSDAINNLMSQTLHTYLTDTWYAIDPENKNHEYFGVWEGSCYFQSTIDVEYTQTPFYLSLWPDLLAKELDTWPLFTVPGETAMGDERFKGTLVVAHDYGNMSFIQSMVYGHHMPVEENTNYILMVYAYWRRTGDFSLVKRHLDTIKRVLALVAACDSTGNGIPDLGMANTIDDACPAVQFGKEQVYLAVKAMAAYQTGALMLKEAGESAEAEKYPPLAEKIRAIVETKGWKDDHFVTVLDASTKGVHDAWTQDRVIEGDILPGWDAAHIYTANGLALLDMVGFSTGLDEGKLAKDLRVATERCLGKYGCRHSDYVPRLEELSIGEGRIKNSPQIGWISMNMLRDISALYRGVDLRNLAGRYWAYQCLTNSREISFFFETIHGNNLKYYPRGVAIWGFFDALAGLRLDQAGQKRSISPFAQDIRVPLLLSADWDKGEYELLRDGEVVQAKVK
jgi:hypothetical protein